MAMGHNVRLALLNQFSPSRAARLACSHSVASRKGAQREVQGYVGLTSLAWRWLATRLSPRALTSFASLRRFADWRRQSSLALRPIRGSWPDNVWQRETKLILYAGAHPPAILIDSPRMRGSDPLTTSDKAYRLIFKESWTCVARQGYFGKDLPK